MEQELLKITRSLACANSIQGTPEGSFDTCWGAAHDLINALRREGIASRKVLLRGWLGPIDLPQVGNHREWLVLGPAKWTHWIVLVGADTFVDMTARQFDRELGHPQIDRIEDLRRRWRVVDGVAQPI